MNKYERGWRACRTCGHRMIECDEKGRPGVGYYACPIALKELRPDEFRKRLHQGNPVEESEEHRQERLAKKADVEYEGFL